MNSWWWRSLADTRPRSGVSSDPLTPWRCLWMTGSQHSRRETRLSAIWHTIMIRQSINSRYQWSAKPLTPTPYSELWIFAQHSLQRLWWQLHLKLFKFVHNAGLAVDKSRLLLCNVRWCCSWSDCMLTNFSCNRFWEHSLFPGDSLSTENPNSNIHIIVGLFKRF